MAHLRQVPDFRKVRGQRYTWTYLLALVAAAVAAGQTTLLTMTDWADQHAAQLIATLQPACPRMPSVATWRRLVAHIDINSLERQVAAHNQALDSADPTVGSVTMCDGQVFRGQAVDGKDVRGARAHGERTFLVSLVRHEHAYVLGQAAVAEKTNDITAVPLLLTGRDLTGTVTTMDALLTQQPIARQILAQGGHYLMIVKANQPSLYEAIALLFRTGPYDKAVECQARRDILPLRANPSHLAAPLRRLAAPLARHPSHRSLRTWTPSGFRCPARCRCTGWPQCGPSSRCRARPRAGRRE